jgi:CRP-like cAMP-binding protein
MPNGFGTTIISARSPICLRPVKEEARLIDLPARSTAFASGDVAEEMFFLLSGEIRIFRRPRTGGEIALDLRRQGGFLAEHVLFQQEYDCDAVTLRASKLLTLPRIAFARVLRDTGLGTNWIEYLSRELRLGTFSG